MAGQEFVDVPIQVLGLEKDDIESRKAELKFQRSLQAFGRIHPDIIEARAVVKTSLLEKDRRRYEVQVFIKPPKDASKSIQPGLGEARRLLAIVEKSQVPFGESAPPFARIKARSKRGGR